MRDDADEQILRGLLESYPAFIERQLPIILQPEGDSAYPDYPGALERLAERLRAPFWRPYNARALPQLHMIIWGGRRLV